MIVVSIIGILASIALPAYQTYTVRAQVAESLTIVAELKTSVADHYKARGKFPTNNSAAGIPKKEFLQGNFVKFIELENGAFHVTLGNKINANAADQIVSMRPIVVRDSPVSPFSWICGYSESPESMQAIGKNKTSVAREFLPQSCRN